MMVFRVLRVLLLGLVAFVAYVLGTRAGSKQYKKFRKQAKVVWDRPSVKNARKAAAQRRKATTKRLNGYLR